MRRFVLLTFVFVFFPLVVFSKNSVSYRVSLTIPESVELSKEENLSEDKEEETVTYERTVITEKVTRQGEKVILKTSVSK
jgi:hypothetical protein